MMANHLKVSIAGQDQLTLEYVVKDQTLVSATLKAKGCSKMLNLAEEWRAKLQGDLNLIPLPNGKDHASLLMKELILRLQNRWHLPFLEDELCHCRAVSTKTVIDSVYTGAHTAQAVSRRTTASTSCGTCRQDVQNILDFILKSKNQDV